MIVPAQHSLARLTIVPLDPTALPRALELAAQLRALDIPVITHTEPGSLKSQLRYVDRIGCRYVVLIGENELALGTLTIKDMHTGESFAGTLADIESLLEL